MKVILYLAISVNGYIAKEDDNVDWISKVQWESYKKMLKRINAAIVGRRTYEMMTEEELLRECLFVVLTTDKYLQSQYSNVLCTTQPPQEVLKLLGKKRIEEVCIIGGGKLNTSFMKKRLIDEIYLDIEPVILGKGIHLFYPEEFEYQLELLETKKLNRDTIQLHYRVKK